MLWTCSASPGFNWRFWILLSKRDYHSLPCTLAVFISDSNQVHVLHLYILYIANEQYIRSSILLCMFETESRFAAPSRPDVTRLSDTSVRLQWSVVLPSSAGASSSTTSISTFKVQYRDIDDRTSTVWNTVDDDIPVTQRVYNVSRLKPGEWCHLSYDRWAAAIIYMTNMDLMWGKYGEYVVTNVEDILCVTDGLDICMACKRECDYLILYLILLSKKKVIEYHAVWRFSRPICIHSKWFVTSLHKINSKSYELVIYINL